MDQEDKNSFPLRLPKELRQKIKDKSAEKRMSMTQFIIACIEDSLSTRTAEERLDETEARLTKIERRLEKLEIAEIHMRSPDEFNSGFMGCNAELEDLQFKRPYGEFDPMAFKQFLIRHSEEIPKYMAQMGNLYQTVMKKKQ